MGSIAAERKKCGEILISESGDFVFHCTFCDETYSSISEFIEQVKACILNQNSTKNTETYLTCDVDDSGQLKSEIFEKIWLNETKNADIQEQPVHSNENQYECVKLKIEHPIEPEAKCKMEKNAEKSKKRIIRSNYMTCEVCRRRFSSKKTMEKHKMFCRVAYEHALNTSGDNFHLASVSLNKSNSSDDKTLSPEPLTVDTFTCRYCHRRFKNTPARVEHECLHTGEKLYKCEICEKCFRLKTRFNHHKKVHEGIKPYKCDMCVAAFTLRSNLNVHIRRHLGEKRYKCDYCEKQFVANTERKHHERSHTGEKPFMCNTCGQCFSTQAFLTEHIKKHSDEKTVQCPNCDKKFFTRKMLLRHNIVHSSERRYKCEICGATFPRSGSLKSHKKIHSDYKEYICKVCGKGFKQAPGLYCHIKSHNKVKN